MTIGLLNMHTKLASLEAENLRLSRCLVAFEALAKAILDGCVTENDVCEWCNFGLPENTDEAYLAADHDDECLGLMAMRALKGGGK